MNRGSRVAAAVCLAAAACSSRQAPNDRDAGRARAAVPPAPIADTARGATTAAPAALVPVRLDRAAARRAADSARGFRVVVALDARRLWVIRDADTLRSASVAIGSDTTLSFEGHVWRFHTPRGVRYVRDKVANPVWIPPDWHYVEAARKDSLHVARLARGERVPLQNGDVLTVRGAAAGVEHPSGVFDTLAEDEEIIFDSTLYIPPLGTRNRRVLGELGRYRLDLGDGYLLHGTPDQSSIGKATTHGCVRLGDDDIAWLYRHVPVGTPVYIY